MDQFITLVEAAEILGYKSPKSVRYHINHGKFKSAKKVNEVWLISLDEVRSFSNNFTTEYFTISEAQKKLGYKSSSSVRKLIENGTFTNTKKFKEIWFISKAEVNNFMMNDGYLTLQEAQKLLGFKNIENVRTLIRTGTIQNSIKKRGKWLISKDALNTYLESLSNKEYITIDQAAEILGYKSKWSVVNLIEKGVLKSAKKNKSKWTILHSEIDSYLGKLKIENYISLKEAAEILNKTPSQLSQLNKTQNIFPNAIVNKSWKIPMADVIAYKNTLVEDSETPLDYYNRQEAADLLGVSKTKLTKLIDSGVISPNVRKINGEYRIPKNDFAAFLEEQKNIKEGYIPLKDAAQQIKKNVTAIIQRIDSYFPNAMKNIHGKWIVPNDDIQKYLESKTKVEVYDSNVALKQLLTLINNDINNFKYPETLDLYKEFVRIQFNKIRGANAHIRSEESAYKYLFIFLKENLNNEIFLLTIKETEILLKKATSKKQKILIPRFINYCHSLKGIDSDEKIKIDLSERKKNGTIYPPIIFNEIYTYSKNIELHKINALINQSYANMWTYTLLLLTDFIRGGDLILQIPKIDLKEINAETLNDLQDGVLNFNECNVIINQLYLHFRNKRASKNKQFLTFIVSPDLIEPLAYALVISEMHRRLFNDSLLLSTFVSKTKYQKVYTSGLRKHKKYFNASALSNDFKFHSQTMNRSVATYLFYSIMEEDAENADLALALTQSSRSHLDGNSTAIYIQLTNKDGYLNRVSINLFRRGYFGWLYNYLILAALDGNDVKHTFEERTLAIEELRKKYKPIQTEKIGKLYLDYIEAADVEKELKEHTDAEKITTAYSKHNSVIEKLKHYSKEKIIEILTKLAKNELPSRSEFGQCLIYPKCAYPKKENCFKCEYFIPQYLVLIELKQEINKIIDLIYSSDNELMINKYTSFLMHYLFLWKEARVAYGEELTSAYLSKDFIIAKIENIAHKLSLK